MHNEELHSLDASSNIIRVMKSRKVEWAGQIACMGGEKCIHILVGKFEGKNPLRRPKRRWEDKIKMVR
jgi:hypothetical protein